ncbi:hypothetical protein ABZ897_29465 [Nonomuraea sp. NPDC046802]
MTKIEQCSSEQEHELEARCARYRVAKPALDRGQKEADEADPAA